MTGVMNGFRVIEVAEHAFVPAAGAILSDWGADVIKIEPVERGDAARGLKTVGDLGVVWHHKNRGKRSLGLDLSQPEGREALYRLVEGADVFLSNKVPRVLRKLRIDVPDLREVNPKLIYMRGTGQGVRGPDADKGSFDLLSYWHRSGVSSAVASPAGEIPFLPAPGFGDLTGAMFIASGVLGALYHRERTGEAAVVDVSLLSTGMWAMGGAIAVAASGGRWAWPPPAGNPLSAIYATKDDRLLALCCLQAGKYWPELCQVIGRPELAADPRFADHAGIIAHAAVVADSLREAFAQATVDEWRTRLARFSGQWSVVQDMTQAVQDVQARANGYLQPLEASGRHYELMTPPVQFDEQPTTPRRGPDFNEHGDEILQSLGYDWDEIVDLKVRGVVP